MNEPIEKALQRKNPPHEKNGRVHQVAFRQRVGIRDIVGINNVNDRGKDHNYHTQKKSGRVHECLGGRGPYSFPLPFRVHAARP